MSIAHARNVSAQVARRRFWIKLHYNSPEMVICALLNFAHAPSTREMWMWSNLRSRALSWWQQREPNPFLEPPADVLEIVMHSSFLDDHNIPVRIRRDGEGLLIDPADFDSMYGDGATRLVLQFLIENGSTGTAHLRSQVHPEQPPLVAGPALTLSLPTMIAGAVATASEIEIFGPLVLLSGVVMLGIGACQRWRIFA